ncbi:unnamed protein product, partial [Notodromas monacha]
MNKMAANGVKSGDQQMNKNKKQLKVVVVGGGLVGTMAAALFAKRGHEVLIYELREDIRKLEHVPGRSINLALSLRGIEALRRLGIADSLLATHAIPMFARMIHSVDGQKRPIPYGKGNEVQYSTVQYIHK